jgi:hypothetical protein
MDSVDISPPVLSPTFTDREPLNATASAKVPGGTGEFPGAAESFNPAAPQATQASKVGAR